MKKISKGKLRTLLFAGVFGLVCIMITMFVGMTYTSSLPTPMEMTMSIVSILTMWMVFVGTYIGLTMLEMANA